MSYAQIIDVEGGDMPHYLKVMDAVGAEPVHGSSSQVTGPTAQGIRIITIWTSRADQERFVTEHLHPASATLPTGVRPSMMHAELDVQNIVIGPAVPTQ